MTKEVVALSDPRFATAYARRTTGSDGSASPESLANIAAFLGAGGETRAGEQRIEALLGDVLRHGDGH